MFPIQIKVSVGWTQVLPSRDCQRKELTSLLQELLHLAQKLSQILALQLPPRLQIEVPLENVNPEALPVLLNNGRIETVPVPKRSGKHAGVGTKA